MWVGGRLSLARRFHMSLREIIFGAEAPCLSFVQTQHAASPAATGTRGWCPHPQPLPASEEGRLSCGFVGGLSLALIFIRHFALKRLCCKAEHSRSYGTAARPKIRGANLQVAVFWARHLKFC